MKPYALLVALALAACSGSQPEQTVTTPSQPAPQAVQQTPAPGTAPSEPMAAAVSQPSPGEMSAAPSAAPSWDPEPAAEMAETDQDEDADVIAASQTAPQARPASRAPSTAVPAGRLALWAKKGCCQR